MDYHMWHKKLLIYESQNQMQCMILHVLFYAPHSCKKQGIMVWCVWVELETAAEQAKN